MSTFEHKNSLRTIEAQIVQKLKNNEARPKFTGSYKKKKEGVTQDICTRLLGLLHAFVYQSYNKKTYSNNNNNSFI